VLCVTYNRYTPYTYARADSLGLDRSFNCEGAREHRIVRFWQ
jgi:hypothetical protein